MYSAEKRRDIQLLLAGAVPHEQIAKLTGASVRTIRRIGRESALPARRSTSLLRRNQPGGHYGAGRAAPRPSSLTATLSRRCWNRRRN